MSESVAGKHYICPSCGCEDFLEVHSDELPGRPVTLVWCEDCGAQYSTGALPWLWLPSITSIASTSTKGN